MSLEELGTGIYLNKDFDFEVDGTGDLRTTDSPFNGSSLTTGRNELEKDIAFNVASALQSEIGEPISSDTKKRVNLLVQNELIEEVRINTINAVSIRELQNRGYEIVADVDTAAGPFELVFEVDL